MRYPIYEMLMEGRDAPLYFSMSLEKLVKMLKSNTLDDYSYQKLDGYDNDSHPSKTSKISGRVKGITLTRNMNVAKSKEEAVVVEFDQAKLARTHKMTAIHGTEYDGSARKDEMEEFVIRPDQECEGTDFQGAYFRHECDPAKRRVCKKSLEGY